jgi:hypothetical protein
LLLLIVQTLMKLAELCKHTVTQALSVQYIVCRLGDARKSMSSTLKKWQKSAWKRDGASPQGSIYPYSEMHGVRDAYENEQHEQAMKAPYPKMDPEEMRQKGLI